MKDLQMIEFKALEVQDIMASKDYFGEIAIRIEDDVYAKFIRKCEETNKNPKRCVELLKDYCIKKGIPDWENCDILDVVDTVERLLLSSVNWKDYIRISQKPTKKLPKTVQDSMNKEQWEKENCEENDNPFSDENRRISKARHGIHIDQATYDKDPVYRATIERIKIKLAHLNKPENQAKIRANVAKFKANMMNNR